MLINGRNIPIKLINETTPFKVYSTESTVLSIVPLNCNHVFFFISKSYVVNDFSFLNSPILIPKFSHPRVNETAFDLYIR